MSGIVDVDRAWASSPSNLTRLDVGVGGSVIGAGLPQRSVLSVEMFGIK